MIPTNEFDAWSDDQLRAEYKRRIEKARQAQNEKADNAWDYAVELGKVAFELRRRGVKP